MTETQGSHIRVSPVQYAHAAKIGVVVLIHLFARNIYIHLNNLPAFAFSSYFISSGQIVMLQQFSE